MPKAFSSHKQNAFKVTFPNGIELSTIWGARTYSDNYYEKFIPSSEIEESMESDTCEIMIRGEYEGNLPQATIDKLEVLLDEKNESTSPCGPYGYVTLEEWVKVLKILHETKIQYETKKD